MPVWKVNVKHPWLSSQGCPLSSFNFCCHFPNHDEFSGRFAWVVFLCWKWVVLMLGGRRVFSQICCWTSNIPPMWRKVADGKVKQLWDKQWKWTSSCFTFCTLIWRLMWVVPLLVVSGASQVAVCWTSFQSYNSLQGGERTRWKSHFFAAPHHHHCELSVVSVNSNGDGLLLVMDTAFVGKVKVFLVLMQVAVVGVVGVVDGGVVGVGVDNVGVDNWHLSLDRRPQLLHRALQLLHLKLSCQLMDDND